MDIFGGAIIVSTTPVGHLERYSYLLSVLLFSTFASLQSVLNLAARQSLLESNEITSPLCSTL